MQEKFSYPVCDTFFFIKPNIPLIIVDALNFTSECEHSYTSVDFSN